MSTIKEYLSADHERCDGLFASMEDAAAKDMNNVKEAFEKFAYETERHFQMEERVMFLEFEQKTGMTQGPTAMMKHEHAQMRNLLKEMAIAVESKDKNKFFGNSETLMILMQQHNMKEEQMIYSIAQEQLGDDADHIISRMRTVAR